MWIVRFDELTDNEWMWSTYSTEGLIPHFFLIKIMQTVLHNHLSTPANSSLIKSYSDSIKTWNDVKHACMPDAGGCTTSEWLCRVPSMADGSLSSHTACHSAVHGWEIPATAGGQQRQVSPPENLALVSLETLSWFFSFCDLKSKLFVSLAFHSWIFSACGLKRLCLCFIQSSLVSFIDFHSALKRPTHQSFPFDLFYLWLEKINSVSLKFHSQISTSFGSTLSPSHLYFMI